MTTHWYIATTKHQQEQQAAAELREIGYLVYNPLRHRELPGRKHEVISGLRFPGYIFVALDVTLDQHSPINNTRHVGELLCGPDPGGEDEKLVPLALRDDWVPTMLVYIDEEFARAVGKSKPDPRADLQLGEIVQIDKRGHASHGKSGELVKRDKNWAWILCGFRMVKVVEIDLKRVEELEAGQAA